MKGVHLMLVMNLVVQAATVASVLLAALTIWASVRMNRRQMNMETFTAYAARFERIMADFPGDAYVARFDLKGELPPPSDALSLCVLRYLNLCSEEHYLWRSGYVDARVWHIWEREIERTLAAPLLVREWPRLKSEFGAYPDFTRFVEHAQARTRPGEGRAEAGRERARPSEVLRSR